MAASCTVASIASSVAVPGVTVTVVATEAGGSVGAGSPQEFTASAPPRTAAVANAARTLFDVRISACLMISLVLLVEPREGGGRGPPDRPPDHVKSISLTQ